MKNNDGTWVKYTLTEQFVLNILFNLGFMIMDWIWLGRLLNTEVDYWYRTGFVTGDIYMRFFYRTLYNIPVK